MIINKRLKCYSTKKKRFSFVRQKITTIPSNTLFCLHEHKIKKKRGSKESPKYKIKGHQTLYLNVIKVICVTISTKFKLSQRFSPIKYKQKLECWEHSEDICKMKLKYRYFLATEFLPVGFKWPLIHSLNSPTGHKIQLADLPFSLYDCMHFFGHRQLF